MSQENVEIVKQVWETWLSGDLDAFLEFFDPEAEWDPTSLWPEDDAYHGRDQIRRFLEGWVASWEQYESGAEEFLDAGDDRVVVLCWQRGVLPGSDLAVHMDFAQLITIKDGLACRMQTYADQREALEAAGLRE